MVPMISQSEPRQYQNRNNISTRSKTELRLNQGMVPMMTVLSEQQMELQLDAVMVPMIAVRSKQQLKPQLDIK